MTAVLALGLSAHARSRAWRARCARSGPGRRRRHLPDLFARRHRGRRRRADRARDPRPAPRADRCCTPRSRRSPRAAVILVVRGQTEIARGTGTEGAALVLAVCVAAALVCAAAVLATGALDAGPQAAAPEQAGARARRRHRRGRAGAGRRRSDRVSSDSAVDELRGPPPANRLVRSGGPAHDARERPVRRLGGGARHPCGGAAGTGTGRERSSSRGTAARATRSSSATRIPSTSRASPRRGGSGSRRACSSSAVSCGPGTRLRVRARRDPVDAGYLGALLAAFVVYLAYAGYDWMWELTAVSVFGLVAASIAIGSAGRGARRRARLARPRRRSAWSRWSPASPSCPGWCRRRRSGRVRTRCAQGDFPTALTDAEDAVASAPWAASPYVHRGSAARARRPAHRRAHGHPARDPSGSRRTTGIRCCSRGSRRFAAASARRSQPSVPRAALRRRRSSTPAGRGRSRRPTTRDR